MKSENLVIIFVVAILAIVLGFAFMTFSNLNSTQKPADIARLSPEEILARLDPGPKVGNKVPDFSVRTINDRTVTLADYQGKPTIIYFWATWCGTCRTSLEELKKVWPEYQGKVNFLGIDLDIEEDMALIKNFVQRNGYVGEYAEGNEDVIIKYYAITTSTKYAIDGNAILLSKEASTLYANDWRKTFDALLS